MQRYNHQAPKSRKRGQRGHDRLSGAMSTCRLIRDDMWAYELIVGTRYSTLVSSHGSSGAGSSYYCNPRWLLHEMYPNCFQTWARYLRSQGLTFENFDPSGFKKPQNFVNVQCFQPNQAINHYQPESKNLLLLSTVADMELRCGFNGARTRQWISNDFHCGQHMSPARNIGIGRTFMRNDTTDDSKELVAFSNSVKVKSEDESTTFMSI